MIVHFDTSEQLIEKNRAAVEVSTRYRHRETGAPFEWTKANLWTLEGAGACLRRRRLTSSLRRDRKNPR